MDCRSERLMTTNLLLVPVSGKYEQAIFSSFTEEVAKYMIARVPCCIEETFLFIETSLGELSTGNALPMVILEKETEIFLGCAGLYQIQDPYPELGIWLKVDAQGKGYGFQVVEALVRWAEKHLNFRALLYPVDERNAASRRIPDKLGATVAKKYPIADEKGNILNVLEYRIVNRRLDKEKVMVG